MLLLYLAEWNAVCIVKLLQFYNKSLSATHIIDERKLWRKTVFVYECCSWALSCVVRNRFVNVGFQYGVTSCTLSKCDIKDAMWQSFSNLMHLWLSSLFSQILLCFLVCLSFLALYFILYFIIVCTAAVWRIQLNVCRPMYVLLSHPKRGQNRQAY